MEKGEPHGQGEVIAFGEVHGSARPPAACRRCFARSGGASRPAALTSSRQGERHRLGAADLGVAIPASPARPPNERRVAAKASRRPASASPEQPQHQMIAESTIPVDGESSAPLHGERRLQRLRLDRGQKAEDPRRHSPAPCFDRERVARLGLVSGDDELPAVFMRHAVIGTEWDKAHAFRRRRSAP